MKLEGGRSQRWNDTAERRCWKGGRWMEVGVGVGFGVEVGVGVGARWWWEWWWRRGRGVGGKYVPHVYQ